jgi:hypothetical protein
LYLADHIRIAEIGPQMVLLDLRRSRYHAVPPPVRDVLRQVMSGQVLGLARRGSERSWWTTDFSISGDACPLRPASAAASGR